MYVPPRVLSNAELAMMVDTSDEWIRDRTGIRERHIAGPDEFTSTMGAAAGLRALDKSGLSPLDIELIIVATSSPDYPIPAVACQIQDMIGAKRAGAFDLVLGCTGFVAALTTAQQFIGSGTYRRVLVIGVDLISRFIDWTDRNSCVLFGDGAGAVVLEGTERECGVLSCVLGSDGSSAEQLIVKMGSTRMRPTAEGLLLGLQYVHMNGQEVFKFASRVMGSVALEAVHKAGMTVEDIELFVPHQANHRIIESAARQIGLSMDRVFMNVERYGNTSAASVPIALCEAIEGGRVKQGDDLALVAFGAGLSWGSAVVRL